MNNLNLIKSFIADYLNLTFLGSNNRSIFLCSSKELYVIYCRDLIQGSVLTALDLDSFNEGFVFRTVLKENFKVEEIEKKLHSLRAVILDLESVENPNWLNFFNELTKEAYPVLNIESIGRHHVRGSFELRIGRGLYYLPFVQREQHLTIRAEAYPDGILANQQTFDVSKEGSLIDRIKISVMEAQRSKL